MGHKHSKERHPEKTDAEAAKGADVRSSKRRVRRSQEDDHGRSGGRKHVEAVYSVERQRPPWGEWVLRRDLGSERSQDRR